MCHNHSMGNIQMSKDKEEWEEEGIGIKGGLIWALLAIISLFLMYVGVDAISQWFNNNN